MTFNFLKYKKISFILPWVLIGLSSFCLMVFGLPIETELAEMPGFFEKELLLFFSASGLVFLYTTLSFRRVIRPVDSWQYGVICLILFLYDFVMCLGIFSVLGKFLNFRVSVPLISGLIIILGYLLNSKLIFFNQIRQNLLKREDVIFEETVARSLRQTLFDQLNTFFVSLFVLFAIFFFSEGPVKTFALGLIVGVFVGSYSTIFLAGTFLARWVTYRKINIF